MWRLQVSVGLNRGTSAHRGGEDGIVESCADEVRNSLSTKRSTTPSLLDECAHNRRDGSCENDRIGPVKTLKPRVPRISSKPAAPRFEICRYRFTRGFGDGIEKILITLHCPRLLRSREHWERRGAARYARYRDHLPSRELETSHLY